nr:MAG TPA: hypothetical protein [Caudoviricetes sp.]
MRHVSTFNFHVLLLFVLSLLCVVPHGVLGHHADAVQRGAARVGAVQLAALGADLLGEGFAVAQPRRAACGAFGRDPRLQCRQAAGVLQGGVGIPCWQRQAEPQQKFRTAALFLAAQQVGFGLQHLYAPQVHTAGAQPRTGLPPGEGEVPQSGGTGQKCQHFVDHLVILSCLPCQPPGARSTGTPPGPGFHMVHRPAQIQRQYVSYRTQAVHLGRHKGRPRRPLYLRPFAKHHPVPCRQLIINTISCCIRFRHHQQHRRAALGAGCIGHLAAADLAKHVAQNILVNALFHRHRVVHGHGLAVQAALTHASTVQSAGSTRPRGGSARPAAPGWRRTARAERCRSRSRCPRSPWPGRGRRPPGQTRTLRQRRRTPPWRRPLRGPGRGGAAPRRHPSCGQARPAHAGSIAESRPPGCPRPGKFQRSNDNPALFLPPYALNLASTTFASLDSTAT